MSNNRIHLNPQPKSYTPARNIPAIIVGLLAILISLSPAASARNKRSCGAPPGVPQNSTMWKQTIGGKHQEIARFVLAAKDGGYIVGMNTNTFGSGGMDVWLMKIDQNGQKQWEQMFGYKKNTDETLMRILQTPDGGIVAYAISTFKHDSSASMPDGILAKYDASGKPLWQKTISSRSGYLPFITSTPGGGFLLYGVIHGYWYMQLDPDGNTLWDNEIGQANDPWLAYVYPVAENDYLMVRQYELKSKDVLTRLSKIDARGNFTSDPKREGELGETYKKAASFCNFINMTKTADGGYIIAGERSNSSKRPACAAKYDAGFNLLWTNEYTPESSISDFANLPDGNVIMLAVNKYSINTESWKPLLIKIDPAGKVIWEKIYAMKVPTLPQSIAIAPDGGFVIAAQTFDEKCSSYDAVILKTDPDGNYAEN